MCDPWNLCVVCGGQRSAAEDAEKEKEFLLSVKIFYSGIRHDLPHETECSGACEYLHLKYDGAGDDFHDYMHVYGDGRYFNDQVSERV